jgi:hypothetical protein
MSFHTAFLDISCGAGWHSNLCLACSHGHFKILKATARKIVNRGLCSAIIGESVYVFLLMIQTTEIIDGSWVQIEYPVCLLWRGELFLWLLFSA